MTKIRDSYLGQAWLVLILSLVFGGTLAGVHLGLEDRVEANQRAETLSRVPELILGSDLDGDATIVLLEDGIEVQMVDGAEILMRIAEQEIGGHRVLEVLDDRDQSRLGWVAHGAGRGYADVIEILIGLRPDGAEITGLFVLAQKETPALGDGITRQPFRSRFAGAPTDRPLEVTKQESTAAADRTRILALTAATISTQSVCDIVNRTVARIQPELSR